MLDPEVGVITMREVVNNMWTDHTVQAVIKKTLHIYYIIKSEENFFAFLYFRNSRFKTNTMIQFILMLFTLTFSNNNVSTITTDSKEQETINIIRNDGPVGGNSGQTPPPLVNP
ncbi:hypothetical protein BBI00_15370 [Chryseobacterium arthrosphaerae]|uniref:Uncharacterized protein n=1 Tax=Chryseobacterium arthrosphaerae TaxID=651561 RepID=A0A1B8ZHQ0_9FLAO|nr:hypothetical protein BBI00_15370 [Chryseobacterium arthrosphaerae]